MKLSPYAWWQTGVIYQVYPRSFQDTDGDGMNSSSGAVGKGRSVGSGCEDIRWIES